MNKVMTLNVASRAVIGKQVKQLRKDGFTPGVIYGPKAENPISVQVPWQELRPVLMKAGGTGVIDLLIDDGQTISVLVRAVQRHPVRQDVVMHVDFYAVDTEATINAKVPIIIPNMEAVSKRLEAKIYQTLTRLEIESLPMDIPQQIVIDMSILENAGQNLSVADLPIPEEVTVLTDPDVVVLRTVSLAMILAAEEALEAEEAAEAAEAAEGDEMQEVEVIGRGRDDDEDEEF